MTRIERFYARNYPETKLSEVRAAESAARERAKSSVVHKNKPVNKAAYENLSNEVAAIFAAGGSGCHRNNSKYRGVGACWRAK